MKVDKLPVLFLRVEGLALLVFSIVAYSVNDFSWWWFAFGLLVPDVSMIGYLLNSKVGAWVYNLGHSLILPLPLVGIGYFSDSEGWLAVGLIWLAHIGMDRLFGYGLKTKQGFHYTHLGKIGKSKT